MLPCPTCNNVREPDCNRGGPVTAYSVTGTGNGAACHEKTTPEEPVEIVQKKKCVIRNFSFNRLFYFKTNKINQSGC